MSWQGFYQERSSSCENHSHYDYAPSGATQKDHSNVLNDIAAVIALLNFNRVCYFGGYSWWTAHYWRMFFFNQRCLNKSHPKGLDVILFERLTAKKDSFPSGVRIPLPVLPRLTGTHDEQTMARKPTRSSHCEVNTKWIHNLKFKGFSLKAEPEQSPMDSLGLYDYPMYPVFAIEYFKILWYYGFIHSFFHGVPRLENMFNANSGQ